MTLLDVQDLRTYFHTRAGIVRAVDGVSFQVDPGETLGIVGESGSGKSVASYSLLGLVPSPPGRIESGTARFAGQDLLRCTPEQLRAIRGKRISMVFQDPMTALNPYMSIGNQVVESLRVHEDYSRQDARQRAVSALQAVGIPEAADRMRHHPHQFSGGMRQRVMIAMALATKPELLIADEPTTALDVTVQAQVLALIKRMQEELRMAVILITHDLGVIAGTCDRVVVMYAGRILEAAAIRDLFYDPKHPYTCALLASIPSVRAAGPQSAKTGPLYAIPGLPPDLSKRIEGCPFAPRCPHAVARCREETPVLDAVAAGHHSACLRVQAGEL